MKTIFKKIAAVCLSMAVMVGVMGATNWGNSAFAASPNLLETSSFEAEGTLPSYLLSDALTPLQALKRPFRPAI